MDDEYLSFAIDSSQIVGGKWWNPKADRKELGSGTHNADLFQWQNPTLNILTRELSPAYLRLGGSEADKIYYNMTEKNKTSATIPEGYHSVLTPFMWDEANAFAKRNHLKIFFTVNAGPSARNKDLLWLNNNLKDLLEYTRKKKYTVDVWELGNEANIFWFIHGPAKHISTQQYAGDFALFRKTIHQYFPDTRVSGQASAIWPVLGEPMDFFYGFMPDYLADVKDATDIVAWHYYPQQSRRGPIASRRAHPARLLNPQNLDEAAHWAGKMKSYRDTHTPSAPLWISETGNAQFGGEPGVSDVYLGGLWWLDQLGLAAKNAHSVVIRQTLVGMDYGMLDMGTFHPRPDYWNSLFWKRLMGNKVLEASLEREDPFLRAYTHCARDGKGTVTLLINLHTDRSLQTSLPARENVIAYLFTTDNVYGKNLYVNSKKLELAIKNNQLVFPMEEFRNKNAPNVIILPPLSYAFIQDEKPVDVCGK